MGSWLPVDNQTQQAGLGRCAALVAEALHKDLRSFIWRCAPPRSPRVRLSPDRYCPVGVYEGAMCMCACPRYTVFLHWPILQTRVYCPPHSALTVSGRPVMGECRGAMGCLLVGPRLVGLRLPPYHPCLPCTLSRRRASTDLESCYTMRVWCMSKMSLC